MVARNLRVMADSNVIIAGVLKPRWFHAFLRHALAGDFRLVLAPQTVREVLRWAERKGGARRQAIETFLAAADFEMAPDVTREDIETHRDAIRDETDIPILLAAIRARVDYLVTNEKDFHAPDTKFCLARHGVVVMLVGTFLRELMGWRSEDLERIRHRNWDDFLTQYPQRKPPSGDT